MSSVGLRRIYYTYYEPGHVRSGLEITMATGYSSTNTHTFHINEKTHTQKKT